MTSKGLKRTCTFLARWAILANGVEPEKFENVAEQPSEQPDIYPVFQRSKPVESRNLSRGMSL